MKNKEGIYSKVFRGRMWSKWSKLKKHLKELNITYEQISNINTFKYDSVIVGAKDLNIILYKYETVKSILGINCSRISESKTIGKILDDDINLDRAEIKKIIGY